MNVSNAAMGTGVLAFPLAYKQAGWLFGSMLTLGYGVIMTITLIIIARAARQHDAISYQHLLGQMFGPKTKSFLMCKLSTCDREQTWSHVSQRWRASSASMLCRRYCRGVRVFRQRLVSQRDDSAVHSHLAAVDQFDI